MSRRINRNPELAKNKGELKKNLKEYFDETGKRISNAPEEWGRSVVGGVTDAVAHSVSDTLGGVGDAAGHLKDVVINPLERGVVKAIGTTFKEKRPFEALAHVGHSVGGAIVSGIEMGRAVANIPFDVAADVTLGVTRSAVGAVTTHDIAGDKFPGNLGPSVMTPWPTGVAANNNAHFNKSAKKAA